jgi:hypothetical protein
MHANGLQTPLKLLAARRGTWTRGKRRRKKGGRGLANVWSGDAEVELDEGKS